MIVNKREELKKFVISSEEYNKALKRLEVLDPESYETLKNYTATEDDITLNIEGVYFLFTNEEGTSRFSAFFSYTINYNLGDIYIDLGILLWKLYGIEFFDVHSPYERNESLFIDRGIVFSKEYTPSGKIFIYNINIPSTYKNLYGDEWEEKFNE